MENKIIVSCTTTHERLGMFRYAMQSVLLQSISPSLFFLNISRDPYLGDSGIEEVPDWLDDDIHVNWVENTGSYRKLLPVIDFAGEDDLIVTMDDDILYGSTWLAELVAAAKSEPDSIVCSRARLMRKNFLGRWQNYKNWLRMQSNFCGLNLVPIGCGGIVYRKKNLDLDFLFDKKYLELAPKADDLWFKFASMRKGIPISVHTEIDKKNIYLNHGFGLWKNHNETDYLTKKKKRYFFVPKTVANYLGVNGNKNDRAWGCIKSYSDSVPSLF